MLLLNQDKPIPDKFSNIFTTIFTFTEKCHHSFVFRLEKCKTSRGGDQSFSEGMGGTDCFHYFQGLGNTNIGDL